MAEEALTTSPQICCCITLQNFLLISKWKRERKIKISWHLPKMLYK